MAADQHVADRTIPCEVDGMSVAATGAVLALVFINYRSSDEPWAANMLCDGFAERLGETEVFLDSRSIMLGDNSAEQLLIAVRSALFLRAVMGPGWHEPRGPDDSDWVRREIATA
ncbi:MAG TPA: toll/interleukin-1 receptor domain-containing protein [Kribbella sp.]